MNIVLQLQASPSAERQMEKRASEKMAPISESEVRSDTVYYTPEAMMRRIKIFRRINGDSQRYRDAEEVIKRAIALRDRG